MSFDVHPILEPGQSPKIGIWYALSPESEDATPSARVGACANFTATAEGGNLILSGGATPEGPYADLYKLELEGTFKWLQLPSKGLPARYEHTAFVIGPTKNLYVFGGADSSSSLNDIWQYDSAVGEWLPVKAKGSIPPPRTYHTTTVVWKDKLIVFGGGAVGSNPVNDTKVYVFDPVTLEWTTPPITGTPPKTRQGHISAVVGDKLFVHGGVFGQDVLNDVHVLILDEMKWSHPTITGSVPVPSLAAHSCAVIDKKVFVFGGLTPNGAASDELYCLDTDTLMLEKVTANGPSPPSRLDHAMCNIFLSVSDTNESSAHQCPSTVINSSDLPAVSVNAVNAPLVTTTTVTIVNPDDVSGKDASVDTGCETFEEKPTKDHERMDSTSPDVSSGSNDIKESALHLPVISSESNTRIESGCNLKTGVDNTACRVQTVVGLFVFGGMDTCGNIYSDAFIYVPF